MKVLIVEDDCWILQTAKEELSVENEVFGCYSVYDALTLFHEHEPDVIVLDLQLNTEGMDVVEINKFSPYPGICILKKIREISKIPIILWTAYRYSDIIGVFVNYENVYYVQKGFFCFNELSKLIRTMNK